jgi:hypothetical protein
MSTYTKKMEEEVNPKAMSTTARVGYRSTDSGLLRGWTPVRSLVSSCKTTNT